MSTLLSQPLRLKALSVFQERFGSAPLVLVHAPGRINLIGEHTDYNNGFVLPAAIAQGICFAMSVSREAYHEWYALDTNEQVKIPVTTTVATGKGWVDYCLGAYRILLPQGSKLPAVRCVFTSDLPPGAGLSSSSALTCGFLLGLNVMLELEKSREELAWLAHLVEHNFIGLQGGIMDQHACLLCRKDHFILLDCLDRTYQQIAFPVDAGLHLFLIDTRVRHKLTQSDYNTRAAESREAFGLLQGAMGIKSLRDISEKQLQAYASLLGTLLLQRITFVLKENVRVLSAVEKIMQRDWESLGQLLYASHAGLRDDYEVSCTELDFLVDAASYSTNILGTRMMGGGFGGCTINLSSRPPDESFREEMIMRYKKRFGRECAFIDVELSESATVQKLSGP
ncbi:MAG TPA: galactokinase [Saprospiraceae bacterium]|nr:galactokinase [Saprospiraceae bacterium]